MHNFLPPINAHTHTHSLAQKLVHWLQRESALLGARRRMHAHTQHANPSNCNSSLQIEYAYVYARVLALIQITNSQSLSSAGKSNQREAVQTHAACDNCLLFHARLLCTASAIFPINQSILLTLRLMQCYQRNISDTEIDSGGKMAFMCLRLKATKI